MKTFYHGTTDLFKIDKVILPPCETHNLREDWRKGYHDKVFFTTSLMSAQMYAKKACRKYGGNTPSFKNVGENTLWVKKSYI